MSERAQNIADRVARVQERIVAACARAGRRPEEVLLVAVSKNMPASDIQAAYRCGLRNFGENRVQEAVSKVPELPKDIRWHFLGQLQRNKARKALEFAELIHSLDRMSLAETLNRLGKERNQVVSVLVEVNTGGEESKAGISPAELEPFLYRLQDLEWIAVKGLMTIAPYVDDPEAARPFFAELKRLAQQAEGYKLPRVSMEVLSMGMTNDYEAAILEGSTLVRIGRGIFGPRRS
ncbi:MAG: YggS family pyridoxal phosphate-dependent enzyme [Firmicutes bacterium]|nr:YggS family pyridoxal phosphate-dependent enzyme [Bacillota bacterium]